MPITTKYYRIAVPALLCLCTMAQSQERPGAFSVSGTAGITYDGYGLTAHPSTPVFYSPRRPWNLVRFSFRPTVSFGNFRLPFNFNFSPMRNNFGSAPYGLGSLPGFPRPTFSQWLTNPVNTIGINPTYKWAELQLGTQYLKYSDLSTGDVGAFGYGFSLKPGRFRIKFFRGVSQPAYQPYTGVGTPPEFGGTYKRTLAMAQVGVEKENKYLAAFNIVKGKDDLRSIAVPLTLPPNTVATPYPAENLIISFAARFKTEKGWYGQTELATTFSTRNSTAASPSLLVKDFKPLINTNTSSYRDHAVQAGFGKKGKGWEAGASMRWLGAGYFTMGYPFVQNDRLEYTLNTRFNTWKNKVNISASIGQRFGNWSRIVAPNKRTTQVIANVNLFAQLNSHFSINSSYNNFGFNAPTVSGGVKNVGSDLSINPAYTWMTDKMSNLLSLTYNRSRFTETNLLNVPPSTANNTHTAMLLYAPSLFNKPHLNPDFSVMYFYNTSSLPSKLRILSVSSSLGWQLPKKRINLRGQLLYNITTIDPFTAGNNLLATLGFDIKLMPKLSWNTSMTGNLNKYGDELGPALKGAGYLESTLRTSLQYRFDK